MIRPCSDAPRHSIVLAPSMCVFLASATSMLAFLRSDRVSTTYMYAFCTTAHIYARLLSCIYVPYQCQVCSVPHCSVSRH